MKNTVSNDGENSKMSYRMLILRLIILAALLLNCSKASIAEPLQGKIEHSRKMPSVNKMLKPGIHYDETADKPMSNAWVRIPHWLAGIWSIKEETTVFQEDLKTGRRDREQHNFTAKSKFGYGKQTDRTGQIWHYVGVPYTSDTTMSGLIEYHQVLEKDVSIQSPNKVSVKTRVIVVKVRKPSGDIKETYQQESINTYTYEPAEDVIAMESSTKAFNADGTPVSLTCNKATIHRQNKYSVVNEEYGRDLKSLFHQFLSSQGLATLVPN